MKKLPKKGNEDRINGISRIKTRLKSG